MKSAEELIMPEKDVIPARKKNVSQSPHVVILGVGASLAALPQGDKRFFCFGDGIRDDNYDFFIWLLPNPRLKISFTIPNIIAEKSSLNSLLSE